MRRIMVTGSRDWTEAGIIYHALLARHDFGSWSKPQCTLVHGACPDGADELCRQAAVRLDWYLEPHPADWEGRGRGAGFFRNTEMAMSGVHECLAFLMPCSKPGCTRGAPGHWSHGTVHAASQAEGQGVPVTRFSIDIQGTFSISMPLATARTTYRQVALDELAYEE